MKFFNRFCLFSVTIAASTSLVSCSLSDEFDKLKSIESIEATGSFNANILNQTWKLKDILPTEKLNFKEGEDGTYSLGYENTSDYIIDRVKFPSKELDPIDIPLDPLNALEDYNDTPTGSYFGVPPTDAVFEISKPKIGDDSFSQDFKIKNIKLKEGARITLALNINSNSTTRLTVTIPSLTKEGIAYRKTFAPIIGSTQTDLVIDDLDGYILNTDPNIRISIQPEVKKIASSISGSINAVFNFDISDHHEYVEGFFGEMTLSVDPVEVSFSLPEDFKGIENSEMTFKEATITVSIAKNNIDIPINLDFSNGNQCFYKGNNSNSKPIVLIPVAEGTNDNTFVFKVIDFNVLNIEKIILNPVVTLNKGYISGDNRITDSSFIQYNISTDLPLNIETKDLFFEQNGKNPFFNSTESESDFEFKDGNIVLIGVINSEIPLGSSIQVYYKDSEEDDTNLIPLFDNPISVAKGITNFSTSISKQKMDEVKKHEFQVLKLTLDGSGSIVSDQKINIKLGLAAKGTIVTKL